MGVPVEFKSREVLISNPVTQMIGYGTYDLPSGYWSDDTSLTIATMDSIIRKKCIDYEDIANEFVEFLDYAKYTPNQKVFDVGKNTLEAIRIYKFTRQNPIKCGRNALSNNGNGSLMRILPIAYYCHYKNMNDGEIIKLVSNVSSITHSHEIAKLGCYIYVKYIMFLLNGENLTTAYEKLKDVDYSCFSTESINKYSRVLKCNIENLSIEQIQSTVYVVDTLEAVLWCALTTDNYKEAVLKAVNLGGDTDTIAAITGGATGVFYGYNAIPKEWINVLAKRDYLLRICENFEAVIK